MKPWVVEIPGLPVPQGSSRAFVRNGRAVVTSANRRLRSWRVDAAWVIAEIVRERGAIDGPVEVSVVYRFPRPASHFGRKGLLPSAPMAHAQKPDLDKLVRATLDAMTEGGAIRDDSRVVSIRARKAWSDGAPGTSLAWRPQDAPGASETAQDASFPDERPGDARDRVGLVRGRAARSRGDDPMTTDEAAIRERWPACDDSEPGTLDSCRERRGHPGLHRSPTGSWGDDKRRIEDLTALLDAERAEVKRLRRAAGVGGRPRHRPGPA